jgi:hypothetical protein
LQKGLDALSKSLEALTNEFHNERVTMHRWFDDEKAVVHQELDSTSKTLDDLQKGQKGR